MIKNNWSIKAQEIFKEILESGQFTDSSLRGGKYVQLFEKALTDYLGKPTIVVNSGTSALIVSLWLAGVRAGDEVIIPAYSFQATKSAVLALQAVPKYCDIKDDYTMKLDRRKITRKTKAIIIVDLYGNICEYPLTHIPIIEDACQALGTIHPDAICADFTCFSFYPTKIVNTMEGGAITVQHEEQADAIRKLRTYPDGLNFRMPEINATMGWLQMQDFKGGLPDNYFQPYSYTLSPPGLCPVADSKKRVKG